MSQFYVSYVMTGRVGRSSFYCFDTVRQTDAKILAGRSIGTTMATASTMATMTQRQRQQQPQKRWWQQSAMARLMSFHLSFTSIWFALGAMCVNMAEPSIRSFVGQTASITRMMVSTTTRGPWPILSGNNEFGYNTINYSNHAIHESKKTALAVVWRTSRKRHRRRRSLQRTGQSLSSFCLLFLSVLWHDLFLRKITHCLDLSCCYRAPTRRARKPTAKWYIQYVMYEADWSWYMGGTRKWFVIEPHCLTYNDRNRCETMSQFCVSLLMTKIDLRQCLTSVSHFWWPESTTTNCPSQNASDENCRVSKNRKRHLKASKYP